MLILFFSYTDGTPWQDIPPNVMQKQFRGYRMVVGEEKKEFFGSGTAEERVESFFHPRIYSVLSKIIKYIVLSA